MAYRIAVSAYYYGETVSGPFGRENVEIHSCFEDNAIIYSIFTRL